MFVIPWYDFPMKKNQKTIMWTVVFVVVVIAFVWGLYIFASQPGQYDDFAMCLEEKSATFYGAFWCPACHDQKQAFGKSQKILPYVECSTPDRQGQLQVCIDAGIENYPTWEFADGERLTGSIPLETLAEKTGCELPA